MLPIDAAVRLNAARRGSAPALVTPERVITHAALAERMARLAAGLEAHCGATRRVGILLGNVPEHLETLFAVATMGGCTIPMDPRWSPTEIAAALRFAPDVIVVEPAFVEVLHAACQAVGAAPHIVVLGPDYDALLASRPLAPADALLASTPAAPDDAVLASEPPAPADARRLAQARPETNGPRVLRAVDAMAADYLVAPTGGTTSGVKGTRISHRATIMRFLIQAAEFGFNADDVYLAATPLFHGGARSFAMGHLYYGGAVVLAGRVATEQVPALVARHNVTLTFLVPTMLRDLAASGRRLGGRFRALIASGSKLESDLRASLQKHVTSGVYNYFASVEAGGIAVARPTDPPSKADTVGRPVWGSEVRLLDEAGQPVARGTIGRVAVRGLATSHGYLDDDSATSQAYLDGAVLTGDLASLDDDGYLTLSGRETDMIISGGINVHPAEVEAVLASHPGVANVAILGVADPRWGEAVTAVVVRQPGATVSAEDLQAYAGQRLAGYKRPKKIVFRDALPLSSMGKVAKQTLRKELERERTP
jgi:acyl-CoA synthetase (AMP-forming)/AMP-acid ligase II